jgi:molecular chaperone GrpE
MTEHKKKHTPTEDAEEFVTAARPSDAATASAAEGKDAIETMPLPIQEYADMQREMDRLRDLVKENQDGWQRERADFSNYKKRVERDTSQMTQNLKADVIKKYLQVLDDLERALKVRPAEGDGAAWADGIELVVRKLQSVLDAEGIQRIPAENEMFDPTRHEAITHEDSPDHESGQVIEVVQQGYTIGDRVIRPALVRVAR